MRGTEQKQGSMLTLLSPERAAPQEHPLRKVKPLADAALRELLSPVFDEMYSALGWTSISPERPAQGELVDRVLVRAQRDAVLRAARLQPALPLVPRPES
jgi:hypothetical protein